MRSSTEATVWPPGYRPAQRATDDARRADANQLIDGIIPTAVGLRTLVWHLRHGARLGEPAPSPD